MTILTAPCKINLGLRIRGRRPDGYHMINSIFYPLAQPCDLLELAPGEESTLKVSFSDPTLDCANNTLTRAYTIYKRHCGRTPGLVLHVRKGIPAGGGLGGGSSDAAALLKWLNALSPSPMDTRQLAQLALEVGADVPFFIYGCPCHVGGIGERISPLRCANFEVLVVLVCPAPAVATSWAYARFDELTGPTGATSDSLTRNFDKDNDFFRFQSISDNYTLRLSAATAVNDLEGVVFDVWPQLAAIKALLTAYGACVAGMSGSGSSVFGIFKKSRRAGAYAAARRLGTNFSRVFLIPTGHAGM